MSEPAIHTVATPSAPPTHPRRGCIRGALLLALVVLVPCLLLGGWLFYPAYSVTAWQLAWQGETGLRYPGGADDGCRQSRSGLSVEGRLAAEVACYGRAPADHEAIRAFYAAALGARGWHRVGGVESYYPSSSTTTIWRRGGRVIALEFNGNFGTADGMMAYQLRFFARPVGAFEQPVP